MRALAVATTFLAASALVSVLDSECPSSGIVLSAKLGICFPGFRVNLKIRP